jgi:hypothetical protein
MRLASLRLRLLAGLVDAVVGISAIGGLIGLGIAGLVLYERLRGDHRLQDDQHERDEQDEPNGDEEDEPLATQRATRELGQPSWQLAALAGASAGLAVAGRNWRGPGFRLFGLRRVDARTGGIVHVRSALVGAWFDQAWQTQTRQLFGSCAKRQRDHISALEPQLAAVQRDYAGDPQARQRAVMDFYKTHEINPFAGCGWQLAGPMVSQVVLALGSRERRTIRDRLTSTHVIVDR